MTVGTFSDCEHMFVRKTTRQRHLLMGRFCLQDHLVALHKKLDFADKNDAARESAAYKDVAPELEKLRVTALHKARDYLMNRWACSHIPSLGKRQSDCRT
jgi:hypothetical protein